MLKNKKEYKRGELSKLTGCNIETIRYYEKENVMPEPKRSTNGYRCYDSADIKRLKFILRCRDLGFSLNEVRELLSLVDGHYYSCSDVNDITKIHIENIQKKITYLKSILKTLKEMSKKCSATTFVTGTAKNSTRDNVECPILEALFEG